MGIKVNFTDTATYGNSSLGLDPLPTGKYHVAITDGEIRESGPNSKNPGSQYINFEFTVQSGDYEGRKVWANASLLPHALYTIKGILEALGYETTGNELDFDRNEVKRFYKLESGTSQLSSSGSTSGGKTSLLP
jgi:hypothetical protein